MSRKPAKPSPKLPRLAELLEGASLEAIRRHLEGPIGAKIRAGIDPFEPPSPRPQETVTSEGLRARLGAGGRTGSVLGTLLEQIAASGLPAPQRELRFHATRRWRFDLAWPDHRVAIEYEGGVATKKRGRHSRGWGFAADCEKYAEAALGGWIVLRITFDHVRDRRALGWLRRALALLRGPYAGA